jgi:hypothetical protein
VTRHNDVATSVRGEATLRRRKGGGDASWADVNPTGQKMKKIHVVDSVAINGR